ncbi:hypothetical protein IEQ34_022986 [Dendrobium chrysotoxum]|uniref:Uncharacterized protein n=1 Tax=Dendrobium chrysotoxum TaxID=161865 RepID=A0AAV7FZ11_DENCH|nr:hypothetical protein IEQ34_022986 [Dendrobium chrysotoxum]
MINISVRCGASLVQFSHRAISLDIRTRDPLKSWAHGIFYVKNDWGLIEKWKRMKDLPVSLYVGKENILRILNIPDVEHLLFEEATLFGLESSRVVKDFKKSIAFKTIIQDHLQEAREYIYDVEVKALE